MSVSHLGMLNDSDRQLDLAGLNCPMPLLKTKQQLNKLATGTRLFVKTTDQGSVRDFNAFVRLSKHTMVAMQQDTVKGEYYFLIKCG